MPTTVTGARTAALGALVILAVAAAGALQRAAAKTAGAPEVIQLTQVACQFLESENGVDYKFKTGRKSDCERINATSGGDRLAKARVMELKPGRYIFRVENRNVPYELGFWLRSSGYDWRNPIHRLTKTSISGGGLALGMTQDYRVELKPGEYVYSCPLNPTPDYRLVVAN